MIYKDHLYGTIKDRPKDARVHCVVLKVRAVPSAPHQQRWGTQKVLSFV